MKPEHTTLHEEGDFRLYSVRGIKSSVIAHRCESYPDSAMRQWWFLPSPHRCFMCGAVPPDEIQGLYVLHNWDRLQAVK